MLHIILFTSLHCTSDICTGVNSLLACIVARVAEHSVTPAAASQAWYCTFVPGSPWCLGVGGLSWEAYDRCLVLLARQSSAPSEGGRFIVLQWGHVSQVLVENTSEETCGIFCASLVTPVRSTVWPSRELRTRPVVWRFIDAEPRPATEFLTSSDNCGHDIVCPSLRFFQSNYLLLTCEYITFFYSPFHSGNNTANTD